MKDFMVILCRLHLVMIKVVEVVVQLLLNKDADIDMKEDFMATLCRLHWMNGDRGETVIALGIIVFTWQLQISMRRQKKKSGISYNMKGSVLSKLSWPIKVH